jgi:hypothetical protein
MFVRCIKNKKEEYDNKIGKYNWAPNLSLNKVYFVISIEYDDYRIQGDKKETGPCLYPKDFFEVVDDNINTDWIKDIDADGSISYFGPPQFSGYFWEDFHNKNDIEKKDILEKNTQLIYGK